MKVLYKGSYGLVLLALLLICMPQSHAYKELFNILDEHKALTAEEKAALRPFFHELQKQYDFLRSAALQNADGGSTQLLGAETITEAERETTSAIDAEYQAAFENLAAEFAFYVNDDDSASMLWTHEFTLPTLAQLLDSTDGNLSSAEQLELEDMQSIMQDVIDEAQDSIDDMIKRAQHLQSTLIQLNKPRIVNASIAGLNVMWHYWGRASRAAYCSYSHVPQLTEALHSVNAGIDCYKYTMAVIERVQQETLHAVQEVKRNVSSLVDIYKRIAAKRTLVGKIMSGTLNLFRALRRIHDIIAVAVDVYNKIDSELPVAAAATGQCGKDFTQRIPQMIETAQNLTICITFVEPPTEQPEFTRPEPQRYWHTQLNVPEL